MKQHCTSILSLTAGVLFLFTTACTTSRMSQQVPAEQAVSGQLSKKTEKTTTETVAGAQTSAEAALPFSAAEAYTQATKTPESSVENLTADNATQDSKTVIRNLREQVKQQKMSFAKKAVVTTALKKMEKMQTKLEVKKVKAAKKGKGISGEYRTPVIIGIIGLALVLIGAFGIWPLYVIGGLALTAALIWILLLALEVI